MLQNVTQRLCLFNLQYNVITFLSQQLLLHMVPNMDKIIALLPNMADNNQLAVDH